MDEFISKAVGSIATEIFKEALAAIKTAKGSIIANDDSDLIIILGKHGSGKTTFLKHLALVALSDRLSSRRVPILISLHDVSIARVSIYDAMVNEFARAGSEFATELLHNLLTK